VTTQQIVEDTKFAQYGASGTIPGISLDELLKLAAADGCGIVARAEESGCEACYIEVARYHESTRTWRRFAFCKVFGGEDGQEPETARATADRIADRINAAAGGYVNFIHQLPDYAD
jgi:hypothetical protein